jgi:murein DD-endopeptidase MepM/ murein hydrolase activator NlpD
MFGPLRCCWAAAFSAVCPAAERVAKGLFYSGNIVIVDHGMGIFTYYARLRKFSVSPNESVTDGQLVGLAGATGRVSGPHLHWGARANGVQVDPLQPVSIISMIGGSASSVTSVNPRAAVAPAGQS